MIDEVKEGGINDEIDNGLSCYCVEGLEADGDFQTKFTPTSRDERKRGREDSNRERERNTGLVWFGLFLLQQIFDVIRLFILV